MKPTDDWEEKAKSKIVMAANLLNEGKAWIQSFSEPVESVSAGCEFSVSLMPTDKYDGLERPTPQPTDEPEWDGSEHLDAIPLGATHYCQEKHSYVLMDSSGNYRWNGEAWVTIRNKEQSEREELMRLIKNSLDVAEEDCDDAADAVLAWIKERNQ